MFFPLEICLTSKVRMQFYIKALVDEQQERVKMALSQIPDEDRRLLALRGYIRFAARIDQRWAMTNAEENEFRQTPDFHTMQTEIRRIRRTFENANAGYTLSANVRARSLNQQTELWNRNDTVLALGKALKMLVTKELNRDLKVYPDIPTKASIENFQNWLKQHHNKLNLRATVRRNRRTKTVRTPSNATPGLSSHGRIKAIDFVVKRNGRVIAGTSTFQLRIWNGSDNWNNKLNTAITSISDNWDGPLRSPNEPWHYTYNS